MNPKMNPKHELLAQVDVKIVFLYSSDKILESTLEIYGNEGDIWAKLGNTDISNELPYDLMERIIEDCK